MARREEGRLAAAQLAAKAEAAQADPKATEAAEADRVRGGGEARARESAEAEARDRGEQAALDQGAEGLAVDRDKAQENAAATQEAATPEAGGKKKKKGKQRRYFLIISAMERKARLALGRTGVPLGHLIADAVVHFRADRQGNFQVELSRAVTLQGPQANLTVGTHLSGRIVPDGLDQLDGVRVSPGGGAARFGVPARPQPTPEAHPTAPINAGPAKAAPAKDAGDKSAPEQKAPEKKVPESRAPEQASGARVDAGKATAARVDAGKATAAHVDAGKATAEKDVPGKAPGRTDTPQPATLEGPSPWVAPPDATARPTSLRVERLIRGPRGVEAHTHDSALPRISIEGWPAGDD